MHVVTLRQASSTPPVRGTAGALGLPSVTGSNREAVLVDPIKRHVDETTAIPGRQASVVGSTWAGSAFAGPGVIPSVAPDACGMASPALARSEAANTTTPARHRP